MSTSIGNRKDHHLDICLNENVETVTSTTGLGGYRLEYDALPEVSFSDVDLSIKLLGRTLNAPIVVGAMTGGTDRARTVNERLAKAAARVGVGMALGSQRAMIQAPETAQSFCVRDVAPELPLLFGNVGAVQLNYGVEPEHIQAAIDRVGADALNFHLNPLQEAIQPEGDTDFRSLMQKLPRTIEQLSVPCLVKEVGAGISRKTAEKLSRLPLAGVESAGVGGTSWAKVESYRAPDESVQATAGRQLAGFGVPTGESIRACRAAFGERVVIGSGGIRTGMDVAVALALCADAVALAKPLLEAATISEEAVVQKLESIIYELRVIAFCTGSTTVELLQKVPVCTPAHGGHWLRSESRE